MNIADWTTKHAVRAKIKYDRKLNQYEDGKLSAHGYTCLVYHGGKKITMPYVQGKLIRGYPDANRVLEQVRLDLNAYHKFGSYAKFCEGLSYDQNNRSAAKLWAKLMNLNRKFCALLGQEAWTELTSIEDDYIEPAPEKDPIDEECTESSHARQKSD